MARSIIFVTATDGRDNGRVYQITEAPSTQTEMFALRILLALANTGVDLGDITAEDGMAGIAALGLQAMPKLPFDVLEPLLIEMFEQVKFVPNADAPARDLVENDIEEVSTRIMLRGEIIRMHMAPFTKGKPQPTV